mmetsp:Transcript_9972/g.20587  ORF Transcript_9972/g.20587 Transcript_9972/m.20587 type:complete len:95 (-) Transcript_9972:282-566(-)
MLPTLVKKHLNTELHYHRNRHWTTQLTAVFAIKNSFPLTFPVLIKHQNLIRHSTSMMIQRERELSQVLNRHQCLPLVYIPLVDCFLLDLFHGGH